MKKIKWPIVFLVLGLLALSGIWFLDLGGSSDVIETQTDIVEDSLTSINHVDSFPSAMPETFSQKIAVPPEGDAVQIDEAATDNKSAGDSVYERDRRPRGDRYHDKRPRKPSTMKVIYSVVSGIFTLAGGFLTMQGVRKEVKQWLRKRKLAKARKQRAKTRAGARASKATSTRKKSS
ncbi:MAG: hypothetical protein LBR70_05695 [Lactobacillaceae bacterium]|jgi:hypothetical protein|nr:hypothetical protein [Lactobacillaceae bacterium]